MLTHGDEAAISGAEAYPLIAWVSTTDRDARSKFLGVRARRGETENHSMSSARGSVPLIPWASSPFAQESAETAGSGAAGTDDTTESSSTEGRDLRSSVTVRLVWKTFLPGVCEFLPMFALLCLILGLATKGHTKRLVTLLLSAALGINSVLMIFRQKTLAMQTRSPEALPA